MMIQLRSTNPYSNYIRLIMQILLRSTSLPIKCEATNFPDSCVNGFDQKSYSRVNQRSPSFIWHTYSKVKNTNEWCYNSIQQRLIPLVSIYYKDSNLLKCETTNVKDSSSDGFAKRFMLATTGHNPHLFHFGTNSKKNVSDISLNPII